MISGITRYTLGVKDASVIDDVYFKAKELYAEDNPPPSGGIVFIDSDDIYAEYIGLHDFVPLASPLGFGQFDGPQMRSIGPRSFFHAEYFETWQLAVPWVEVEVASSNRGCEPIRSYELSESSNTKVVLGMSHFYAKYDGVWKLKVKKPFLHAQMQEGSVKRLGCIPDSDSPDYNSLIHDGVGTTSVILNDWGNWWHPFPGSIDWPGADDSLYYKERENNGDWRQPDAIAHLCYARLELIDPNGVDDRHLSEYIVHTSMDKYIKYNNEGTTARPSYLPADYCPLDPLHCNDWDTGISKYKTITNDWQLCSMLTPNIEMLYPNYNISTENILDFMSKADYDFFFADMPIPTEPL